MGRSVYTSTAWNVDGPRGKDSLWKVWAVAMMSLMVGAVIFVQTKGVPDGMPQGDLPGWKLVAAQDFLLPAAPGQVEDVYGSAMRGYSGFVDSSGQGTYTPDAVLSVTDGTLDYYLHMSGGKPRVASVIPFGYQGQTYGRYSVRFKYDSLPGYKIAFLLWPSSDNWNEGEIDWPEGGLDGQLYGSSAVKGSLDHGTMKFDPPDRQYSASGPGNWHVATTEWTPGKVKWYLDGQLVGQTRNSSGVPNTSMRWTLQAETADNATESFPSADVAGHLQVDWVAQYAYVP
ncbi:glycoside hydrolase family 16 protein [Pseudarthrobacter sp. NIBRBAC000502771]|nr:glycoside hydrolase family 16 protein [Pseudarthrobacter sp. NIBRBAC000502771]